MIENIDHPSDAPFGPAPAGRSLEVTIECTTDTSDPSGIRHLAVIRPNWDVETPHHDLEAERVGRALGGWCSCLHFAERIVPAYRRALGSMVNAPTRNLRALVRNEISPDRQLRFGAGSVPDGPLAEAERTMFARLFARAGEVWSAWGEPRYVQDGVDTYIALWHAGIAPTTVERIARSVTSAAWPLPATFYERAYFDDVDATWLASVLNCYPEPEFALWASEQSGRWERYPAGAVWRLYTFRIGASDAIAALEARVAPTDLTALAARPGVDGTAAVRWLTLWSRAGAAPSASHLRLLEKHRVLAQRPETWLPDWTLAALRRFGPDAPSRTELTVMLALSRDVDVVERAVADGIRTATDSRFIRLITTRKKK